MIRLTIGNPMDPDFESWEERARAETESLTQRWKEACQREGSFREFLNDSKRIKRSVYRHATVKRLLWERYHHKCAFCERRILDRDASIEHFRPKGRVTTIEDGSERQVSFELLIDSEPITVPHPGYFWLSYKWENLLLTCSGCNQRLKRSLFPLKDESKRAFLPGTENAEEELLIHPGQSHEDLSMHFGIHRSGFLLPLTDRAQVCVEVFGLNDEGLVELRRKLYQRVRCSARRDFEARIPDRAVSVDLQDIQADIKEAEDGSLEFSAFGRAAIEDWRKELEECYQNYQNYVDSRGRGSYERQI